MRGIYCAGHRELPDKGQLLIQVLDTCSEAWRLECEARLLLTMPLEQRREYLGNLKEPRRKPLEDEMRKQWNAKRGKPS